MKKQETKPEFFIHFWKICNKKLKIVDVLIFDEYRKMEYIENTVRKIAEPKPFYRDAKPNKIYYETGSR